MVKGDARRAIRVKARDIRRGQHYGSRRKMTLDTAKHAILRHAPSVDARQSAAGREARNVEETTHNEDPYCAKHEETTDDARNHMWLNGSQRQETLDAEDAWCRPARSADEG